MTRFAHVGVVIKQTALELVGYISQIQDILQPYGVNVYCDRDYGITDPRIHQSSKEDMPSKIDLMIVIGGDGTLLSTGRDLLIHKIPVIGINKGTLGFMTDISVSSLEKQLLDMLVNENYQQENRTALRADIYRNKVLVYKGVAINDIVISRGSASSMLEFELSIDDQFVHSQKSDGVIFSTPTGSTAYSLAAGGPILHPSSRVFSIVPICPHSLSNRPLVVDDESILHVSLVKQNDMQIHYDGQERFTLLVQDEVVICRASVPLVILHPIDYDYYHTLRSKLHWSKQVS